MNLSNLEKYGAMRKFLKSLLNMGGSTSPEPLFQSPEMITRDPTKLARIKMLEDEYKKDINQARFRASMKSWVAGSIPAMALGIGAGSAKQYLIESMEAHAANPSVNKIFSRPMFKKVAELYERHPRGTKFGLGIAAPLVGTLIGSAITYPLRTKIYQSAMETEQSEVYRRYNQRIKDILASKTAL